jgi:HD superfamily phosphohydrolase YqeK
MPLDSAGEPDDDDFEHCLRIAKAALTLISYATDDDSKMLAILGAMTEMTLKHLEDDDDRVRLTDQFLATLMEHMAR